MKVLEDSLTDFLWDKIFNSYEFYPSTKENDKLWIKIPIENKTYRMNSLWNAEQEALINSFFEQVIPDDMYALNWQHDCFSYSPKEKIPFRYNYYDEKRDCNVYFPTYYPDGDYYFFFNHSFNLGIFGHPWRKEIKVMGKNLIDLFEENRVYLDLEEVNL